MGINSNNSQLEYDNMFLCWAIERHWVVNGACRPVALNQPVGLHMIQYIFTAFGYFILEQSLVVAIYRHRPVRWDSTVE